MATLVTLAEYKAYAGIPSADTSRDAQITVMLSIASEVIRGMAGRDLTNGFESTSRTEVKDGNGTAQLQLIEWPVGSITSVAIIDDDGTSTTLTADTDYVSQGPSGLLTRGRYPVDGRFAGTTGAWGGTTYPGYGYRPEMPGTSPAWPVGLSNISVVYTGGYATIPYGIKMAVYKTIDGLLNGAGQQGQFQSESISGDYSYTRGNTETGMITVAKLMEPYMTGTA